MGTNRKLKMKIIIAGSRGFDNYELLKEKLDFYLKNINEPVEIVSGTAKGADTLGEKYAIEKGYAIKRFPANWDKFGKKAGYMRNSEMAEYGTHCVCFWDGKSSGTKSMIELAEKKEIKVRVVLY